MTVIAMFSLIAYSEEKDLKIVKSENENQEIKINVNGDFDCADCEEEIDIPNLSDEQEKKIEKIELNLEKSMVDLEASIEKLEIEITELLIDDAKLDQLYKKIEAMGKIKTEIDKNKMESLMEIKKLLDSKQQKMLNDLGLNYFEGENEMKVIRKIIKIEKNDDENNDKDAETNDDETDDDNE